MHGRSYTFYNQMHALNFAIPTFFKFCGSLLDEHPPENVMRCMVNNTPRNTYGFGEVRYNL